MCGRVVQKTPLSEIRALFETVNPIPNTTPTYNGVPTDTLPVVRLNRDGRRTCIYVLVLVTFWVASLSDCLAQALTEQDFRSAPRRLAPPGATPAAPSKPHVDYDTIFVDESDLNKIFGNWSNDAPSACRYKTARQYQLRSRMTGYTFESTCHGSKAGIWNFTFQ
jgi:hypothetical protein